MGLAKCLFCERYKVGNSIFPEFYKNPFSNFYNVELICVLNISRMTSTFLSLLTKAYETDKMLQGQNITSATIKVRKSQTINKHVTPIFAVSSKNWEENLALLIN